MNASQAIAVFDLGKTNSKLFVFDSDGRIVAEDRTRPVWLDHGDLRVLGDAQLMSWIDRSLAAATEAHGVGRVIVSAHGCTFALIEGDGLTHPILDYEQEPPEDVAERIDVAIPDFTETFSPRLPLGFNYGRHLLWLEDRDSGLLTRSDAILCYPQYWSWALSGRKVSEVSYLGCHSHLWAPLKQDFSSLVDRRGWRAKMPPLARAGAELGTFKPHRGPEVIVHNAVHDSNSALYFYRQLGFSDFTLVSSGTWVVIFNPSCPLEALDQHRDMLANVTIDARPAPTIRFMGGREYDIASGGWNKPISREALESVIRKRIFALPAFAPGGPMSGREGRLVGPEAKGEELAAAALLYVALMTDLSLDLIRSGNTIVIDGGLVKTGLYGSVLAALRPDQHVLTSANAEGSAFGAATLAFESTGRNPFANKCREVERTTVHGLDAYRDEWRALAETNRSETKDAAQ